MGGALSASCGKRRVEFEMKLMLISRSRRGLPRRVFAAVPLLAGTLILAGCASNIGDRMPSAVGGLPEGVPQRPETPPAYPAVHDMPPARSSTMLTAAEQKKLEDDLAAARARAATATGSARNP
jgi:hypothetical protein